MKKIILAVMVMVVMVSARGVDEHTHNQVVEKNVRLETMLSEQSQYVQVLADSLNVLERKAKSYGDALYDTWYTQDELFQIKCKLKIINMYDAMEELVHHWEHNDKPVVTSAEYEQMLNSHIEAKLNFQAKQKEFMVVRTKLMNEQTQAKADGDVRTYFNKGVQIHTLMQALQMEYFNVLNAENLLYRYGYTNITRVAQIYIQY